MNERIKELAEQAEFSTKDLHIQADNFQKFAELIIKECIQVVDDTITENQEMNIGLVMASAAIVSHFGVE